MTLIISENGKGAQRLAPSSFDKEDYLQQYIYNNPDAIPVYEIDEDIRLLVLAREFSTASGPIDALGVDQYGNIYLIETKLYKNPDKRTVVALSSYLFCEQLVWLHKAGGIGRRTHL